MGVHFEKVPPAFPQLRKKSSERGEKGEGGRGREGGREGERERGRERENSKTLFYKDCS